MGYLVINEQVDLEAVAGSVLKARLSRSVRQSALEAIRAANPGLDFTRLQPGAVVVIPPVEGAKVAAHIDGLDSSLENLARAAQDALTGMADDTLASFEVAQVERKETQAVLSSSIVARLADQVPQLKERVESVRAVLAEDARTSKRQAGDAKAVVDGWIGELEKLRTLSSD